MMPVASANDAVGGRDLPLSGVTVLEFTQLIMGPVAGLVLADLGADVIKIEPAPNGDPTRQLSGFTSGFSDYFNRNKRSVALDLKHPKGKEVAMRLARSADVVIENFAPGTMDRLGLGAAELLAASPRLVYCTLKGFLPGPYEHRTALDEAVQFMGGLAYMTGPPGMPLRSGTSVVDLMGGTMAVVAIMAALRERERTGRGQLVQTGLFESVVFLMGQHMAAYANMGEDLAPMPARQGGWAIYQLFDTRDQQRVFIAVTNDSLWQRFCQGFELTHLASDERLRTNALRLTQRDWMLPEIAGAIARLDMNEVLARCERAAIPSSRVATVADLARDPHLVESGALVETLMRTGEYAGLPGLPFLLDHERLRLRRQPPRVGEHTREVLRAAGLSTWELRELEASGAIACAP